MKRVKFAPLVMCVMATSSLLVVAEVKPAFVMMLKRRRASMPLGFGADAAAAAADADTGAPSSTTHLLPDDVRM